jgi:AraC-like DNA-binding protein
MLDELGLQGTDITQSQYKNHTHVNIVIVDVKSQGNGIITAIKNTRQSQHQPNAIQPAILALVDCCQSDKSALFKLGAFDYFTSPLITAEFNNRIRLAEQHINAVPSAAAVLDNRMDCHLADKTAHYLKSQLAGDVRLSDLVCHMGTNKNKLRSAFRACYGTTLFDWLAQQRLQCAADLLATSSLTIVQIAAQVGYPDSNNFSTAFKRVYQLSPTRYRQSIRRPQSALGKEYCAQGKG